MRRLAILFFASALVARPSAAQRADTTTYADAATAALVGLARERHLHQDSLVHDYRAIARTRLDAAAGRSRFARLFPLIANETAAQVTWRRPNDLRVEVIGVRQKSIFPGADAEVSYDRPWFVPRALGDSIRLMGVPETAALHPLAPGAERYYQYAITDSVIMSLPGRTVRAITIRVQPRELAPSMVAGDMWVDAETADVVRLMVTFLGEYLWDTPDGETAEDSSKSRSDNRWAQSIVTVQADLEYSLLENRYWMPYRQLLAITVEVSFIVHGALPVRALTTFSDYEVNFDPTLAFSIPEDSLDEGSTSAVRCGSDTVVVGRRGRCAGGAEARDAALTRIRGGRWVGGRWEVVILPRDSLAAYAWGDSLAFDLSDEDAERIRRTVSELASIAENLPAQWVGRRRFSLAWDGVSDMVRFNRVQGLSVGAGYEVRPGPAFTTLRGGARFGVSDHRLTGSLTWRRDGPGGALGIKAFRSVSEAEPWSAGQSLGNSLNALFTAHDDADYYLAWGGGVSYYPYDGFLHDVDLSVGVERHWSLQTRTGSALNDALGGTGVLAPNPPVLEGDFVRARAQPHWRVGRVAGTVGVEGLLGKEARGGRAWATARLPFSIVGRTGALSLKAAHTFGDSIPQLRFRAGGPTTVRGYPYGFLRGQGLWAAQLDVAVTRRWAASPVVFVDAGNVFTVGDPFSFDATLVSVGVGASLLNGWMRVNLAKPLNPSGDLRFDLLFGAPR